MQSNHLKIYKIAHDEIYSFIKLSNSSLDNYNYEEYFDYITTVKNIIVFEHHFEQTKILGVTQIDDEGKTISYERDQLKVRQNFTKCHEIGHVILKHEGGFFTEQINNKNSKEIEANYFSSIILAPDIVLLNKIAIENKNFYETANELNISHQSLIYRLSNLVQKYEKVFYDIGNETALEYKNSKNNTTQLKKILFDHKEKIENIFNSTKIDPFKKFQYLVYNENTFISQYDIENITQINFRNKIKNHFPNYEFWAYYDKGKAIWFCWNTEIFSKEKACQIAKSLLFEEIYKKD